MSSMVETSWPPKSPREALLSSPSGRKKFQEMQNRRELFGSPLKRSSTTPNCRAKAEQLLSDGVNEQEDEDEDEETLKLKLAAIEARLKLKQLQKNRAKSALSGSDVHETDGPSRPTSSTSFTSRTQDLNSILRSPRAGHGRTQSDDVQVPVSPTRKVAPPTEPASPRRYLLGIDKGLTGKDVSLRRPPVTKDVTRPSSKLDYRKGVASEGYLSPADEVGKRGKSFSERIAETRQIEKSRRERAEKLEINRSSAFHFDKAEMESFKAAAAEAMKDSRPRSPVRARQVESFSREDVLRSYQQNPPSSLKRSQTAPSVRNTDPAAFSPGSRQTLSLFNRRNHRSESDAQSPRPRSSHSLLAHETREEREGSPGKGADSSKFEAYSSLHLSNRILPHSFLTRTLADKKVLRIPDLLRTIKGPDFELPADVDGDYVVFGIVASKSPPKDIKEPKNVTAKEVDPYDDGLNNTNKYMAITLTDLEWTIDLFLFDTAFPRYYKLSEGILIAILNPTIMPPPKHKLDTNRFSLAISSSDDKILEVGFSRDIGFCKAVRKDGKTCQSWIDARKTEFCDFHVDLQVRRTQAGRMGVNSGPGMFGPGGRSGPRTGFFGGGKRAGNKGGLKSEGAQYDRGTQSVYYMAPAPKSRSAGAFHHPFNPAAAGQSAASLIDADEDPFIAAGLAGRGMENKEERLRRRLAEQQRERDITQKLVTLRGGGVGADYLRAKTGENAAAQQKAENTTGTPPPTNSLGFSSFRRADTVRLSPKKRAHDGDKPNNSGVKKTRFITAKGIKEAGRDSLGGASDTPMKSVPVTHDDDDDDDLDII